MAGSSHNCKIDGKNVGHTWVRYSPYFKKIKLESEVSFEAKLKKYGKGKVGIDWNTISHMTISGGDNSSLYQITIKPKDIEFIENYRPSSEEKEAGALETYNKTVGLDFSKTSTSITATSRNRIKEGINFFHFATISNDYVNLKFVYNIFAQKLILNSKYLIIPDDKTKNHLDQLTLFEYLTKISNEKFWLFANNKSVSTLIPKELIIKEFK